MTKLKVFLISIVLVVCFAGLIFYGFYYARGVPGKLLPESKTIINVPYIEKTIDLKKGIPKEICESLIPTKLDMVYQITVLPWPKKLVPAVNVKAFHNKKDIYFCMQWKDSTQDRVQEAGKFSDGGAIMFPLGKDNQPSVVMMGFLGKANIWHWKASVDNEVWGKPEEKISYADWYNPFEDKETLSVSKTVNKSAINDLITVRIGTLVAKDKQVVEGRGIWEDGQWNIVFKRSLASLDKETGKDFVSGTVMPCAFAVWNGADGDRGGRKSISSLIDLKIE